MTKTHQMKRMLMELWEAQGRRCPFCAEQLPEPFTLRNNQPNQTTFEHVWPRSLTARVVANLRKWGRTPFRGNKGNGLAAHYTCNERKGGRLPTACELLWLEAVNRQLGWIPMPWSAGR